MSASPESRRPEDLKWPASRKRRAMMAAFEAAVHEAWMIGRRQPHRQGAPKGAYAAVLERACAAANEHYRRHVNVV